MKYRNLLNKKNVLYGLIIWLTLYFSTRILYPFYKVSESLYESTLMLILVFVTLFISMRYFQDIFEKYHTHARRVSLIWIIMFVLLDIMISLAGFGYTNLGNYMTEIGLKYFVVLLIINGSGCVAKQTLAKKKSKP